MNYDYEKEFFNAINNSEDLGLEKVLFSKKNSILFDKNNEEKFKEVISGIGEIMEVQLKNYIGNFNDKEDLSRALVANCTPIHYKLKPYLEEYFNQKLFFTTGYVSIGNQTFHKMDLKRAKECLQKKEIESNHHVWLTTESMEIIDLTFGITTMMLNQNQFKEVLSNELFKPWMALISIHPNDLKGMEYHPLLIGENFYENCGFELSSLSKVLYS